MNRTNILLITAVIALIFLCSDVYFGLGDDSDIKEGFRSRRHHGGRRRRHRFRRGRYRQHRPMCSGSGCSHYDKFGYYRNWNDFYEHNQYRFQYPSYPLVYSDYPNDYFIDNFLTYIPLRKYFWRRLFSNDY